MSVKEWGNSAGPSFNSPHSLATNAAKLVGSQNKDRKLRREERKERTESLFSISSSGRASRKSSSKRRMIWFGDVGLDGDYAGLTRHCTKQGLLFLASYCISHSTFMMHCSPTRFSVFIHRFSFGLGTLRLPSAMIREWPHLIRWLGQWHEVGHTFIHMNIHSFTHTCICTYLDSPIPEFAHTYMCRWAWPWVL